MPTLTDTQVQAEAVRQRLINRPRTMYLKTIAEATGVSERWLQQLIAGTSNKPSVAYIGLLNDYLNKN